MAIGEKFFTKTDSSIESAFNESMFALRRQDNILTEINRIGFEMSQGHVEALRPYLSALERFYMELSVVYASEWIETKMIKDGKEVVKLERPPHLKYVETVISNLSVNIAKIEANNSLSKGDQEISAKLKSLELYLRRLKQLHGMGVKREEVVDDEQRLEEAFGL